MKPRTGVLAILAAALVTGGSALSQDHNQAEMMKRMVDALKLTDHHREMGQYVGRWKVEREMTMPGMGGKVPGTAEIEWLIPKRWLCMRSKIPMMGMMTESFMIMGYDKVKKKFVSTGVSSTHPGIIAAEGPVVDPDGKVQVQYGALDEYLTDEHDKPIKYVLRHEGEDKFVFELWDLGIGPEGKPVVVDTYTRVDSE